MKAVLIMYLETILTMIIGSSWNRQPEKRLVHGTVYARYHKYVSDTP